MENFAHFANGSDLNFNLKFNFSIDQALDILQEHFSKDKIFEQRTETAIVTLYVLIMAVGLFCNLLVSGVVLSNTKIRSSRNVLVINLNVSDMILCVFCMPFTLLVLIRRSWFVGAFLCKMVPFVQASTIFVSATTVLAIAIDRYKAILSFNLQKSKTGSRDMTVSTFFIWVTSFLLSIPMCVFQGTIPVGLPGLHLYNKCVEIWPSSIWKGIYTIIILLVQFVIPASTLLLTHLHIRCHLNARILRVDSAALATNGTPMNHERLKRDLSRNTRAIMVLLIISVVFTLSWLPWNCINVLAEFNPNFAAPQNLYLVFAICHMAAMSSSVTNPILYGWLNNNIRHEIVRLGWVMAKSGSAFMSNLSTRSGDGMMMQRNDSLRRSSGIESTANRSNNLESKV